MELFLRMERKIDRLDKYAAEKGLSDNKMSIKAGLTTGVIGKSRKDGRDLSAKTIEQLLRAFRDINPNWLMTGEGSMTISGGVIGSVGGGGNIVGHIHGDIHTNGGKDAAIAALHEKSGDCLEVLRDELNQFHAKLERKDAYIREILSDSFARNQENMQRIDKLINMIALQNDKMHDHVGRIQEQNDRLFVLIEKIIICKKY